MIRSPRTLAFAVVLLGGLAPGSLRAQQVYDLDELLRIGREQNPTVQALRAAQAATEAQRRSERPWENPELEYEWGSGKPRGGGASRDLSGFSIRQSIENPFSRHYRVEGLRARVGVAGEEVRLGLLDVDFEIRMHFYRILFLEQMVEVARLNEAALEEIRTLMETRARVGEVMELEAIRLRVEHLRARNELEAVELELDQYRRHLNTFLGNVLPEDFLLQGTLAAEAPEPEMETLVRELLPHHPALARAALELESAEYGLREQRFGWLPDPVVSGSSRTELDGRIKSFGLGLQIPLWNQSRAATREARERVREQEQRQEALRLEKEAEVMIHLNHLRRYRQTLELFEEGLLEQAEESMQLAETSYRAGEISLVDYLDARRTFHSIQIQRQEALLDWNVERATLHRASGGGVL